MRNTKAAIAQPAPTDPVDPSQIDVRTLSAAAQSLVATFADALRDAESRIASAELAASKAEERAANAENVARDAHAAAAAATAALDEERRRHADDLAGIAKARDALDESVDRALAAAGVSGVPAVAISVPDDDVARDDSTAIASDALVEDVCAAMIAQGEVADRAGALSLLLAEAAALRARVMTGSPTSLRVVAPPS